MTKRIQTFTTGEHVEFPAADDDDDDDYDETYPTCNAQYYCQQVVVEGPCLMCYVWDNQGYNTNTCQYNTIQYMSGITKATIRHK